MFSSLNCAVWYRLEESLTPLPKQSKNSRIWHHLPAVVYAPAAIVTGTLRLAEKTVTSALSFCCCWKDTTDPNTDFSAVLRDSRKWKQLGNIDEKITLGHGNPKFLYGAATCTYQDSGAENCPNSQWAEWEKKCLPENNRSGSSAHFFEMYQTPEGLQFLIDRLNTIGATSYRCSVDWSHIEPKPGEFDELNLQIYVNLCKALRDAGIEPMITLHHFSEPLWFHKLGSFEKEENIKYFLRFIEFVYPVLTQTYHGKPLVELFCTINEPGIEAFSRYVRGAFSPGVKGSFTRAGNFLKTALKAHNLAYDLMKKLNSQVKVGLTHQRLCLEPANGLLIPVTRYINRLNNECILNAFKTGKFELKVPFVCNITEDIGKLKCDFVGLQYYVRALIGLFGPTSYHEPMTQMPLREDPEGLYEATIEVFNAAKKPIILTEFGISTHDDVQRARYISRALYAFQRAGDRIGHENIWGIDGLWSICDNSEWNDGKKPQAFGAYALDENGYMCAEPKKGMETFMKATQAWKRSLPTQQEVVS